MNEVHTGYIEQTVEQGGAGPDETHDFVFLHPFTAILAGPSSCGKTTLLKKVLERCQEFIQPSPQRIVWYYKRWQPTYDELTRTIPSIEFREGLPDPPSYCSSPTLYILDDLMSSASGSDTVCNMFTEGSHHLNISVFFISQNMFYQSKHNRSIQLNTSYLIIFKNPRNTLQVSILARDMYPANWKEFLRKYERATAEPYGYLLVDLKQETPEHRRLVTKVITASEDANRRTTMFQEPSSMPSMSAPSQQNTGYVPRAHFPSHEPVYQIPYYQRPLEPTVFPCEDCGTLFGSEEAKDEHCEHCGEDNEPMDDSVWAKWVEQIREKYEDKYNELYEKVDESDGETRDEIVSQKMKSVYRKALIKKYKSILEDWLRLERSEYHRIVMSEIRDAMKRRMTSSSAIRQVLRENEPIFDEIVSDNNEEEDDDEMLSNDGSFQDWGNADGN